MLTRCIFFSSQVELETLFEEQKKKGEDMAEEFERFQADTAAKDQETNGIIANLEAKLTTLSGTNDALAKEIGELRERTKALEIETEKMRSEASEDDEGEE